MTTNRYRLKQRIEGLMNTLNDLQDDLALLGFHRPDPDLIDADVHLQGARHQLVLAKNKLEKR